MLKIKMLVIGYGIFFALPAAATCSIHNDTGLSFTIESGNTSNQRVGAHTQTSIASGKITGKSDNGKAIAGVCKDGDKVEITEKDGNPILTVK